MLDLLRTNLRYEDLELVADAALAHNLAGSAVRRLYAQAAPLRPLPHCTPSEIHKIKRYDRVGGLLHEYQQVA